jgi:hypothetical protein
MRKLLISSPVYGTPDTAQVSWAYSVATNILSHAPDVAFVPMQLGLSSDLVRARSRGIRYFLDSDATHYLMWDVDVIPRDLGLVTIMINAGVDFITLPYPRKRVRWDALSLAVRDEDEQAALGRQSPEELEGHSVDWPLRVLSAEGMRTVKAGGREWPLARISECGMGFTMITRRVAERMVEVYGAQTWRETVWKPETPGDPFGSGVWVEEPRSLVFNDDESGKRTPTVALFQLMQRGGELCSEDYSFCYRWRDLGGDIWMLGDAASHIGNYRFGSTFR